MLLPTVEVSTVGNGEALSPQFILVVDQAMSEADDSGKANVRAALSRARTLHYSLAVAAVVVSLLVVMANRDQIRLLTATDMDLDSLDKVLNKADLAIHYVRSYLSEIREETPDEEYGIERIVRDTLDAYRDSETISAKLINREPGDPMLAINQALQPLRKAVERVDRQFVDYRAGSVSRTEKFEDLTLRDIAVLTRYAKVDPMHLKAAMAKALQSSEPWSEEIVTALKDGLNDIAVRRTNIAEDGFKISDDLLAALTERSNQYGEHYVGGLNSTYRESTLEIHRLAKERRLYEESVREGFKVDVPGVGLAVPAYWLVIVYPVVVAVGFLAIFFNLDSANDHLAEITDSDARRLVARTPYELTHLTHQGLRHRALAWFLALGVISMPPFIGTGLLFVAFADILRAWQYYFWALTALAFVAMIGCFWRGVTISNIADRRLRPPA